MDKIIFRSEKKIKNQQGFTLIELLIIVFIIAILASVILVSVHSASVKAGDNSTFTSLKSAASASYMCLLNGASGVNLSTPKDSSLSSICMSGSLPIDGYSSWPSIAKNHWKYGNGSPSTEGFSWCRLNESSYSPCSLGNGNCGQSPASGIFCFGVKNDSRTIWCNQDGCHKIGF